MVLVTMNDNVLLSDVNADLFFGGFDIGPWRDCGFVGLMFYLLDE
jgi:hypothetical protein